MSDKVVQELMGEQGDLIQTGSPAILCTPLPTHWRSNKSLPVAFKVFTFQVSIIIKYTNGFWPCCVHPSFYYHQTKRGAARPPCPSCSPIRQKYICAIHARAACVIMYCISPSFATEPQEKNVIRESNFTMGPPRLTEIGYRS
jgi:hypothetical protein